MRHECPPWSFPGRYDAGRRRLRHPARVRSRDGHTGHRPLAPCGGPGRAAPCPRAAGMSGSQPYAMVCRRLAAAPPGAEGLARTGRWRAHGPLDSEQAPSERRPGMTYDADIVVAGAGHNSLLTACYLAKAGYRCLVLDARAIPGGGAATEELLLPGFGIDTCATGHTMIRVNPVLSRDELGLTADYGLRYAEPDPVEHVAFPDGRAVHDVAGPGADGRGGGPVLQAGRGRLPAPARRVRPGQARSSARPSSPRWGSGRRWTRCSPSIPQGRIWARRRAAVRGAGGPARVRTAGTSRPSCCGWRSRSSSRPMSRARACSPTRRRSGGSSAAGPSRSAGPGS